MSPRCSRVASLRAALLGLTALGGAACVGTPLPEPPDELPAPDHGDFTSDSIMPTNFPDRPSVQLGAAGPGTVQPGSRVWFINLDAADAPAQVSADAQGGLVVPPIPALPGERIRVLVRTERQHSAPLDFEVATRQVAGVPLPPEARPLSPSALSCLRVTPAPTLVLRGTQGALRLENACGSALSFSRLSLRFGDQGLTLVAPPAELAAGASVSVTIRDARGAGASERLDIVLIDAQAADGRTGRVAIDVFSALE